MIQDFHFKVYTKKIERRNLKIYWCILVYIPTATITPTKSVVSFMPKNEILGERRIKGKFLLGVQKKIASGGVSERGVPWCFPSLDLT